MGNRTITSHSCPTCGHDKGHPTDFVIPEVPVVATEDLKEVLRAVADLSGKLPKGPPDLSSLTGVLERVAAAGEKMEASAEAYDAARQTTEAAEQHSKPTPELFQSWENCQDCQPAWAAIKAGITQEARKGHISEAEHKTLLKETAREVAAGVAGG